MEKNADTVLCPYCNGSDPRKRPRMIAAYLLDLASWLYRCTRCGFAEIHAARIEGKAA